MSTNDRADPCGLLHNMSAPPKTYVKYSGLADLAVSRGKLSAHKVLTQTSAFGLFGTPVRFALAPELKGRSPTFLLRHLGVDPSKDPDRQLAALINSRANELALPEGCAVIPALACHPILWADTLSALAILAKCSESIWLRDKTPALSAALQHKQVTLLVPPLFVNRLPKAPR